ncbi:WXG100 family type VII secretion target [Streptomyces sp. NBC_01353]|uniref:WXG100 family type VII secretion target n=1 Tax=Streptomyces sp. NBC_01353 TaxID=2903835 RepID=UPI002E37C9A3|nr:WXG100 family type VII secretion target [Streptomyces sp. NBC_01353]
MATDPNLAVTDENLTKLADELGDMQSHLDQQVKRMDAIVDAIEARWRGPAAKAYRRQHREAAKDAVRIREIMKLIEAAVRMSRDGFTEQELDALGAFRRIQMTVDVDKEAAELSTPNTAGQPPVPGGSRILAL